MHGLVLLDAGGQVIRPSLIWCDQRSQPQVDAINAKLGSENVLRWTANPVLTGFTLPKTALGARPTSRGISSARARCFCRKIMCASGSPATMPARSRTLRARRSSTW